MRHNKRRHWTRRRWMLVVDRRVGERSKKLIEIIECYNTQIIRSLVYLISFAVFHNTTWRIQTAVARCGRSRAQWAKFQTHLLTHRNIFELVRVPLARQQDVSRDRAILTRSAHGAALNNHWLNTSPHPQACDSSAVYESWFRLYNNSLALHLVVHRVE